MNNLLAVIRKLTVMSFLSSRLNWRCIYLLSHAVFSVKKNHCMFCCCFTSGRLHSVKNFLNQSACFTVGFSYEHYPHPFKPSCVGTAAPPMQTNPQSHILNATSNALNTNSLDLCNDTKSHTISCEILPYNQWPKNWADQIHPVYVPLIFFFSLFCSLVVDPVAAFR